MRKIISLVMVLAMLVSSVAAMGISAGAKFLNGAEGLDYVEAYYFASAPTIDGVVSEAEWGAYTFELTDDSGTVDSQTPYYNSFKYWKGAEVENTAQVWLRWDENHFYIAAKVRDYDGHSLKHGKGETWNGDALQFRVDPDGPNSVTEGEPESYTFQDYEGRPWVADEIIPDFVCGYSQIAGGFVECFDNTNDLGLTAYSKPSLGAVDVAVAPSDQLADSPLNYSDDTLNGYTSYELAIPWKYIYDNGMALNPVDTTPYTMTYTDFDMSNLGGGIGRELGMSLVVYNAEKGSANWNAFLSWGSGITNTQEEEAPQTCKGSNSVTLSATQVTPGAGYATGDVNKLNAIKVGGNYATEYVDYLAGVVNGTEAPSATADTLKALTYDDPLDMEFWGSAELFQGTTIDVGGEHGMVLNYDRMIETKTDPDTNETRYEGVDAIDQFYIDSRLTDTVAWNYPLSYTFEFDFMYTGTEVVQDGRESIAANLFGGADAVEYQCGYSFNDRQFVISEWGKENVAKLAYKDYELAPNTWYNWKFQYDNDSCTARLLINDEPIFNAYNRYFYYSNEQHLTEGTMMIFWMINTQCKFDNVKVYNFFDYIHKDSSDVDNTRPGGGTVVPPTIDSAGKDDVSFGDVSVGEDGTFNAPVNVDKNLKNIVSKDYKYTFNSSELEGFDFVKFAVNAAFTEDDYTVETDDKGNVTLTIKNVAKIKALKIGDKLFDIVLKANKDGVTQADLKAQFDSKKDKLFEVVYQYSSPNTSDNMLYVAVVAAVVLAGCAVVCTKKRRSF